ncbi:hypothetical protein N665_0917s0013 [Sinapis alba]|nr:hypothetical protein N665_0917s0013 [Sinapis alba]
MKCNFCWEDLEGQAVVTACGNLFCCEDAAKILRDEGGCPVCDQPFRVTNDVEMNPNEHWINMAMIGVTPELAMRTASESLKFYISQMELQCENKMNRFGNQCREQCQGMKSKCIEKMEQVREAYEKLDKRCGLMEQEGANLTKDKQELQEKFSETSSDGILTDLFYGQKDRRNFVGIYRRIYDDINGYIFYQKVVGIFSEYSDDINSYLFYRKVVRISSVYSDETPTTSTVIYFI